MTREELLKHLAEHCYIWPRHSAGRTYPAVSVTKGYGADPHVFTEFGGDVFVSARGKNAGKTSWVLKDKAAVKLMQELRPLVNSVRRRAIDTWNDYSQS